MKRNFLYLSVLLPTLAMSAPEALACTNLIAGKKATTDGSVLMTYAADSHNLYGMLTHTPTADHAPGTIRKVTEWDTGKPLGSIPQVAHTYNVVGNMNEHQLAIGESTWGGREELVDTTGNAVIDYGSLIRIALERSRNAREAIKVMTDLVNEHGYASSGESFSIADKNEVWVLEMIGKGAEKGAVWIAVRIPDDAISGHANEPRIHKVDMKDKENVMHSKDVISFAKKRGYFNGKDEDFSFADAYSTHDQGTRRGCDGRVRSYFRRFDPKADKYFAWCNYESDEPMPLYIIPERKVSLKEMQESMRDHFEGTPFEMTSDIGSEPNHVPYRWRPMEYEVDGKKYTNERAIATQQNGWSFVSQSRADLPDPVGECSVWHRRHQHLRLHAFLLQHDRDSRPTRRGRHQHLLLRLQPRMTNWVANQAYNRYDLMIPDIRKVHSRLEEKYQSSRPEREKELVLFLRAATTRLSATMSTRRGKRLQKRPPMLIATSESTYS